MRQVWSPSSRCPSIGGIQDSSAVWFTTILRSWFALRDSGSRKSFEKSFQIQLLHNDWLWFFLCVLCQLPVIIAGPCWARALTLSWWLNELKALYVYYPGGGGGILKTTTQHSFIQVCAKEICTNRSWNMSLSSQDDLQTFPPIPHNCLCLLCHLSSHRCQEFS